MRKRPSSLLERLDARIFGERHLYIPERGYFITLSRRARIVRTSLVVALMLVTAGAVGALKLGYDRYHVQATELAALRSQSAASEGTPLSDELARLRQTSEAERARRAELEADVGEERSALEAARRSMGAEAEATRARIDLLTSQLASAEQEGQRLRADLEAARTPGAAPAARATPEPAAGAEPRPGNLGMELALVEQERDAARGELEASLRRKAELEAELATARAAVAAAGGGGEPPPPVIDPAELQAARARIGELEASLGQVQATADQAKAAQATGEAELARLKAAGEATSGEMERLRTEQQRLQARIGEIEPQLERLTAERRRLEQALASASGPEARTALDKARAEAERLRTESAQAAGNNARLQGELTQATAEVGRLRRELEEALARPAPAVALATLPGSDAREVVAQAKADGTIKAELAGVLSRLKELDGKLAEARARNAQLEAFLGRRAPIPPAPAPR